MLFFLVKKHGQLVEKKDLVDFVWGRTHTKENSLSQCIHAIRKALGDDFKKPRYIKTAPNRGFRFIAELKIEKVRPGKQSDQVEEKTNNLKNDIHFNEQHESRAIEREVIETYGNSVNSDWTNDPLALADNKFLTARSFGSIKTPTESFGAWLESSAKAQKLPRASFDELSLLKMGKCTVLRTAVDPGGYEDIVMEPQQQTGEVKLGIAIDDQPLWETEMMKLDAARVSGKSAQVMKFREEYSDDPKARVQYRVINYTEARAFHEVLQTDITLSHRYREDILQVLSRRGTDVPNILATAVVAIIGSDEPPQLVLANRQSGTGGYHGGCWAVSIGEQYMPVRGRRKKRMVEADRTIFRSAERGLCEELLSDGYSGKLSLSVHAFILEDYIDNFFFLAIADLRPLTFNELKELWHKSVDRAEHNAIAALPLSKDVLLECMREDGLPEDCWSQIKEAGLLAVQPGIRISGDMHGWQPNSHIRLAGCLWYLQNELT